MPAKAELEKTMMDVQTRADTIALDLARVSAELELAALRLEQQADEFERRFGGSARPAESSLHFDPTATDIA